MRTTFFNCPWGKISFQEPTDIPGAFKVVAPDGAGVYIPRQYFKFLSEDCISRFATKPDLNAEGMWFHVNLAQRALLEIKAHVGLVEPGALVANIHLILERGLRFLETSHPLAKEINVQINRGNADVIAAIEQIQHYR